MESEKRRIREDARKMRFRGERRTLANHSLVSQVLAQEVLYSATHVGLFAPQEWEVDLLALWHQFPKRVAFPIADPKTKALAYYKVNDLSELQPGYAGIREPAPSGKAVEWQKGDVLFVPGLAFDAKGARIGSGEGFFDRLLAQLPEGVLTWGICWKSQLSKQALPQASYDMKVAAVFTEI